MPEALVVELCESIKKVLQTELSSKFDAVTVDWDVDYDPSIEKIGDEIRVVIVPVDSESDSKTRARETNIETNVAVFIQKKIGQNSAKKICSEVGIIADYAMVLLNGLDVGLQKWRNGKYVPFIGENIKKFRVYTAVVFSSYETGLTLIR